MKKRFWQVPVIPALRNAPQPHRRVRVYAGYLDVREHGTGALPHQALIPTIWRRKFRVVDLIIPVACR